MSLPAQYLKKINYQSSLLSTPFYGDCWLFVTCLRAYFWACAVVEAMSGHPEVNVERTLLRSCLS